jgi:hypothetical protein
MTKYKYVTVRTTQDAQTQGLRGFYHVKPARLTRVDELEPLQKTPLYERFDVETVRWIAEQFRIGGSLAKINIKFGRDGETGRGFIEY